MDATEEYKTLRQEILDWYTREVNLITFGFTATAAILGYGFTAQGTNPNPNPLVFLVPILILGLILVQLNNSISSILTISVYIRVFIECKSDGPKWETTIDALRNHFRKQKRFHLVTLLTEIQYALASIGMGMICVLLAFYYDSSKQYYWISVMIGLAWLAWSVVWFRPLLRATSGQFERDLRKTYEELKARGISTNG